MLLTDKLFAITTMLCFFSNLLLSQNLEDNFGIKSFPFVKNSNDPASMSYLDELVNDYNHFFMDEYHSLSMDRNLKKKFISYLAEKKRLNKIVMEEPYSYGYWVNKYLQTGDTVLLHTFLDNYYIFGRYGKNRPEQLNDYYDFFKFVYALNKNNKIDIEVVGIDISQTVLKPEFWTLKRVFEKYNLGDHFQNDYEKILKLEKKKKVSQQQAKRWLNKFNNNRIAKEDVLKQKLGDELIHLDNIISNLSDALKMHTLRSYFFHPTGYRDSLMHIRYIQQVKPEEVAFSQFGGAHMLLSMGPKVKEFSNSYEFKSFTSLVNKESEYIGKCMSFHLVYGEKGYTWGSYFFSDEEYKELRRSTNYEEVLLDFRNAQGSYSNIAEYYQIAIFLNGRL